MTRDLDKALEELANTHGFAAVLRALDAQAVAWRDLCIGDEDSKGETVWDTVSDLLSDAAETLRDLETEREKASAATPSQPYYPNWPKPTQDAPTFSELKEWDESGDSFATDGCSTEPDGVCEHGHPSWLLYLGYL